MSKTLLVSIFVVFTVMTLFSSNSAFAQTNAITSKQTTLSKNLENDPLAQDILRKIEMTKQWIADLEKRNYEKLQAQKILEEKRTSALERLNEDLKEWENLWSEYSSRPAFERFVAKKPSSVQGVFWDQFEFKELRVNAGKEALKKVIADGGTLAAARQAYNKAAETKRIELIELNSQFNVKHNLAYYKQQLLFDTQGKFVNTPETQNNLHKYYTDYRADPAYLAANPDDKLAYDELGKTNPDTQCRSGYIVIQRLHANDYACVTESTAEMWVRLGMGQILGKQSALDQDSEQTNPLSECKEGYKMVKVLATGQYSCVTEATATEWTANGIAESPDVGQYIMDKIQERDARTDIYKINERIGAINSEIGIKQLEIIKNYDSLYKIAENEAKDAEKSITKKFLSQNMTKAELSSQLATIREHYKLSMKGILDDKIQALEDLKKDFDDKIIGIEREYGNNSIKITWNADTSNYEVVTDPKLQIQ